MLIQSTIVQTRQNSAVTTMNNNPPAQPEPPRGPLAPPVVSPPFGSPTFERGCRARVLCFHPEEKTNIRLGNEELALNNLKRLFRYERLKDQEYADARAIMAQAYINLNAPDTAIQQLKVAQAYTKKGEEELIYFRELEQETIHWNFRRTLFLSYLVNETSAFADRNGIGKFRSRAFHRVP